MTTAGGVTALLALEDMAPPALLATLPGTGELIWPHVRMAFARAAAEDEMSSVAVASTFSRSKMLRDLAGSFTPSTRGKSRLPSGTEFLFLSSGVTTRDTPQGRENWLVDEFATEIGASAAVLQSAPIESGPRRPRFPRTYSYSGDLVQIESLARFSSLNQAETGALREAIREFASLYPYPLSERTIAQIEAAALARIPRSRVLDRRLLGAISRVRPRAVFVEDASYGSMATLIARLKAMGILVVEPQHGWIGASHSAYNFGAAMSLAPLADTLPDVLLTFGQYWGREIRHPARLTAIGKPHMNAMSVGLPAYEVRDRAVLVASSIADPEATSEFVLRLRDALPLGWRVIFRPHPSERESIVYRYPALVDADRVAIDSNVDVYDSLRQVRGVFGVASTVLYEALGMGCHVFVRDTVFASLITGSGLGERIAGDAGISRAVAALTGGAPRPTIDPADLWAPGAIENFRHFLDELTA